MRTKVDEGGAITAAASSSKFKGVSKHRLTGRWEASVWVQVSRDAYPPCVIAAIRSDQ